MQPTPKVLFYRNASADSEYVEAGLKERGIDYLPIMDDLNEDLSPAIVIDDLIFETAASIKFYFFDDLDKGNSVGGIRSVAPTSA
jgi:hypothetical protein